MVRRRGVAAALVVALLCLACAASVDGARREREDERGAETSAGREKRGAERALPQSDEPGGEGDTDPMPSDGAQSPIDGELIAELMAGGGVESREQEGSVEEVAASMLATYRDQGDCVLASTGYLDLYGSVWSCVVRGSRWADVCIVSAGEDGSRCQVIVLRMREDEVAALLEGDP